MSLETDIQERLNALADYEIPADAPMGITFPLKHGHATCQFTSVDRLSCALQEVVFQDTHDQVVPHDHVADLNQRATQLSATLTYLLEPIVLQEIDPEHTQLRSSPPARDEDRTVRYYELMACARTIALQRFQKSPGHPRQSIPMIFTREVLVRLLGDLDR
jgi:hypothetical protein